MSAPPVSSPSRYGAGSSAIARHPASERDRLLTLPEVARILGISRSAAYLLAKSGRLPSITIGPRIVRVRPEDLEDFILRHRRASEDEGDDR